MPSLKELLKSIAEEQRTLTRAEARAALSEILTGEAGDIEIAGLLTAFATRGETADELTGFAEAMRALALPVPLTEDERASLIDTCGTGGDGRGTFNISTGAALVATAAGAKVAKHGNRGVTSKCGSADVLEAMGVPVALTPEESAACLRATGFTFLYAPALQPAMKRVQPIRRALGFRTIFNLAGPLTNPAGATAQVMGIFSGSRLMLVANAMARLGVRHAFVVHGSDGLDELTLTGESSVAEVQGAGLRAQGAEARVQSAEATVRLFQLAPEEAELPRATLAELAGAETAAENAAILEGIFNGEPGPRRDIVLLNAAAALMAGGIAEDLRDGVDRGAEAIDSGAVFKTVAALRTFAADLRL
ncbi:anthranilate phosphoribosyltransferase [Acidipila sp. 4G-K13]|uniref:Anthranilate phosphoribosyltransferase n=2 Tax=Paracidobacterium acidisoli TaxID=2303751 RepID=A0A372IQS0_9BACT|nr:anthranilate phosphoribosyltransferase [Paracidobacterium acidisoli]MBT9331286.1 anthranilate phosphoribosyltransferase [Paracidobacterium acidisoli]